MLWESLSSRHPLKHQRLKMWFWSCVTRIILESNLRIWSSACLQISTILHHTMVKPGHLTLTAKCPKRALHLMLRVCNSFWKVSLVQSLVRIPDVQDRLSKWDLGHKTQNQLLIKALHASVRKLADLSSCLGKTEV